MFPILIILGGSLGLDQLWADDGGWREAGGTFDSWLKSEGAIIAILVGISPALGAILGILTQQVLTDIANNLEGESSVETATHEVQ